jgi:hypothetical protein
LLGFVEPGEAFNFVEGEAVWYVNRAAGVTLEPSPLQGPAQSTNLADFTLRASPGATVRGLSISGVQGEDGLPGPYASEGLAAPSVAAIRVIDSSDVRFEGGLVERVRGGRGGRASVGTLGGTGGRAAGLWIERSPGSAIVGLSVRDIFSGDGGAPFEAIRGVEETFGRPGRGGDAFGIIVSESDGTQVANVLLHHIVGHSGGVGLAFVGRVPMGGAGGLAYNVTVADFGHPSRFDPRIAPPDVYLDLGIGAYAEATVSLVNSIVAFGDGNGIGADGNGSVIAGWSFIYDLGGASLGPGGFQTESVFTDFDPLFVDRAARDYSLAANSLCIDRGSPQGTCVDEPRPEGALECLTDLGHLGNTADAQFQ